MRPEANADWSHVQRTLCCASRKSLAQPSRKSLAQPSRKSSAASQPTKASVTLRCFNPNTFYHAFYRVKILLGATTGLLEPPRDPPGCLKKQRSKYVGRRYGSCGVGLGCGTRFLSESVRPTLGLESNRFRLRNDRQPVPACRPSPSCQRHHPGARGAAARLHE
jgi:hypothetical protein